MSWIKPTREDLTATISSEEIDAFSASADFSDVVDANLRRTVQLVRGYVRALSIFKEVGAGRMAVEPHEDEDGSSAVAVAPMTAPPTPARLLD